MRRIRWSCVVVLLCLVGVAASAATAAPPDPTYGTAVVDGSAGEWNLTSDFYAPMYNAGNPADPVLANGYLRYDCTTGTLYVLVLQQGYGTDGAVPLLSSPTGNAWAYLDGSKSSKVYDDGGTVTGATGPVWIGLGYDGTSTDAKGYEASFPIASGDHTIVVHVEAEYNGAATAGFAGFNTNVTTDTVALDIPASCTNTSGGGGGGGGGTENPGISLVKKTDGVETSTAPGTYIPVGDTVDWSYVVTNTGDVSLSDVGVTDDQGVTVTCPGNTLDIGASMTCTGSGAATAGQYTNTGTASGTSPGGAPVTASDTNYYYGVVDPSIAYGNASPSDPASTSYNRTFNWSIAKSASPSVVKQIGGNATVGYSVTAAETGYTDGGWQLTGTIELSNSNGIDLSGLTVTDSVDTGGSCQVADGTNVSLPHGGSVELTYTCTWTSAPTTASGTDTASVSWDAAANHTPDGSATVTTPFAFGAPTDVSNGSVTVSDTYAGTLGTLHAITSTPYTSTTYTYSRTFAVPTYNCAQYPNTATVVETGQSASKTVTICGPAKTGALTIGYWQNKNGQSVITTTGSTGGVCNLTAYLRGYAPFQDLSATASCSAAASYIATVIKKASAAGAAMNAMLKAQMLATALDVYYSSPSLGGNKIGAPAPIGGVSIDLTAICSVTDGSGGSGSCTGAGGSASAAFGGASTMTIAGMLTYAASQSNSGASSWYGNVKATQSLAKNAFDAINNQLAFTG